MVAIDHDPEIADTRKGFSVGLIGPKDRSRRSLAPFQHQFRDLGCVLGCEAKLSSLHESRRRVSAHG